MNGTVSADRLGKRRRLVTAACMVAMFMAAAEGTIVATAMPTIVAELGGFRLFGWVFAAYFLAQAVTTPIYGRLADMYGRKRVFVVGSGVFLAGSIACGLADGMVLLVLSRALQGVGAGAIQPVATTIIGDIYTANERAWVQGWLSSVWGVAAIVGPALGAFIVEHAHWALVFWINVPVGLAAIVMIGRFLDEKPQPRRHRLDYAGSTLLMLGTSAVLLLIMEIETLGRWELAALLAAAVGALAAFAVVERHIVEPILPFRLWRSRVIAIGNFGGLAIGALFMSVIVFLPTYIQGVMGKSALVAGLVLAAQSVAWTFGSIAAGRLMVRTSYRLTGAAGGGLLIAGSAILLMLDPGLGPVWASLGASVIGIGMGFCSTTLIVSTQTNVGWSDRGAATSSVLFMRMIGQALGAGVGGAILNFNVARYAPEAAETIGRLLVPGMRAGLGAGDIAPFSEALAGALHEVYLIAGALAVVTLVLMLRLPAGLGPTTSGSTGPK